MTLISRNPTSKHMPRKKKRNGAGLALDDDSIQTVIKMLANPLYPVDVVAFAAVASMQSAVPKKC